MKRVLALALVLAGCGGDSTLEGPPRLPSAEGFYALSTVDDEPLPVPFGPSTALLDFALMSLLGNGDLLSAATISDQGQQTIFQKEGTWSQNGSTVFLDWDAPDCDDTAVLSGNQLSLQLSFDDCATGSPTVWERQ